MEHAPSLAVRLARLVKFSHTVFALPFAAAAGIVAAREVSVTLFQAALLLIALIAARTAAMTFNRVVDREIDRKNPRTADREIPRGAVSVQVANALLIVSSLIFLTAAAALGNHCLILAPLVLATLFLYSYCKRFTSAAHLVLGTALALAPGGVWYAITAQVAWAPVALMAGVALWVAGFDVLYALQDTEFDRAAGLHSIPAKHGVRRSMILARWMHFASFGLLAAFGAMAGLGALYFAGIGVFAAVVLSQHWLLDPNEISKIDGLFFTRNGAASMIFFLSVLGDVLIG